MIEVMHRNKGTYLFVVGSREEWGILWGFDLLLGVTDPVEPLVSRRTRRQENF